MKYIILEKAVRKGCFSLFALLTGYFEFAIIIQNKCFVQYRGLKTYFKIYITF